MQAIGSAFASVGLVFLTDARSLCHRVFRRLVPVFARITSRKTTLINHSLATPYDRCDVRTFPRNASRLFTQNNGFIDEMRNNVFENGVASNVDNLLQTDLFNMLLL